jgi:hypothetical protein
MRFYLTIDGETAGPFDHVQLLTLYRAGIIDDGTNCQKAEQGAEWTSLSEGVPSIALAPTPRKSDQRVTVADLEMKFGSMMVFMVKWVFASIPAAIIVIVLVAMLSAVLGGVFVGLLGGLHGVK